jgi:CBS domain-containing protein
MERGESKEATVLSVATVRLVVTYSDELLEDAVERMVRHDVGRLPVVSRDDPTRLLGYLGRPGIAEARRRAHDEEQLREPGWLSASGRLFRLRARRIIGLERKERATDQA